MNQEAGRGKLKEEGKEWEEIEEEGKRDIVREKNKILFATEDNR